MKVRCTNAYRRVYITFLPSVEPCRSPEIVVDHPTERVEIFDGVVEHAEGEELRVSGELQREKAAVGEAGDELMAAREPSASRPT